MRTLIGDLDQTQAEQAVELSHHGRRHLEVDQTHARSFFGGLQLGLAQRLQQIQATHFDHGQRNVHALSNPGTAGSRPHQGIDGLAQIERLHLGHRIVEGSRDMREPGLTRPGLCQPLQHPPHTVAAYGDDVGQMRLASCRHPFDAIVRYRICFIHENNYFIIETEPYTTAAGTPKITKIPMISNT
jgi:hypothetical protein